MPTVTTHLWYDDQAVEAATLYTELFPDSSIDDVTTIRDTPSGDCDIVSFRLFGQSFQAISAGPVVSFTPAISFVVRCSSAEEVDAYWKVLSEGGEARMPLDSYPFSERFGWTADKYGLDWQLILDRPEPNEQRILPTLLFVGDRCGKADDAMNEWTKVFPNGKIESVDRYGAGEHEPEGNVRFGKFSLAGTEFVAMESALDAHQFDFNEAISFMVNCKDQAELDHYWNALSTVPESEQCGWLKDQFGVSWQIIPEAFQKMMSSGTAEQKARVTEAFLQMKKFDVETLERAYSGETYATS